MPADEPDPPRKFYDFKPREFERVNAPANEPHRPAPPARPAAAPDPARPITVREIIAQANAGAPPAANAGVAAENDVHGILQHNLRRANAAGLNKLELRPPRPSRRKRDYLAAMTAGNVFFLSIALIGHGSPILFVCGLSGAGMFSAGVTWIMWGVMDRY